LYCTVQKKSIPAPWKVNGNSEGVGDLKSQKISRKVWGLTGIISIRVWRVVNPKSLPCGRYKYVLEKHID